MATRSKTVGKALLVALLATSLSFWPLYAKEESKAKEALAGLGLEPPKQALPAPDFDLADLDGSAVSVRSFKGRFLVLHFWATWSPSAPVDLANLEKLQAALSAESVSVIAVATDTLGKPSVESFLEKNPVSIPVLLDPRGTTLRPYDVRAVPTTVLINGEGDVVGRIVGSRQWNGPAALEGFKKVVKGPGHYAIITSGLPVKPAERSR